ncbi:MAG TPA: hypothetical protein VGO43_15570 [Pyrinomonadaceae bacterium]|jgi:hypothetical protein|nr:hypothetical protein [Pyrinomonadaceae bacterium]
MQDEFDHLYSLKGDATARNKAINSGKAFLENYGFCPVAKERSDWLRVNLPRMQGSFDPVRGDQHLVFAFDAALKTRDWETLYENGDKLLQRRPDNFGAVELVLADVGYDELIRSDSRIRENSRWADRTLKYAKQSLVDLQAGKVFRPGYGVLPFLHKSREDAIAWMNLIIGTVYVLSKENRSAGLPYLYRATLSSSELDVAKNPLPYEFIGDYYLVQFNKSGPAAKPQLAERAMGAFARAFTRAGKTQYKTAMRQKFITAYRLRWGDVSPEYVETLIRRAAAAPWVDPETHSSEN